MARDLVEKWLDLAPPDDPDGGLLYNQAAARVMLARINAEIARRCWNGLRRRAADLRFPMPEVE